MTRCSWLTRAYRIRAQVAGSGLGSSLGLAISERWYSALVNSGFIPKKLLLYSTRTVDLALPRAAG
jgi:hypothetical protein